MRYMRCEPTLQHSKCHIVVWFPLVMIANIEGFIYCCISRQSLVQTMLHWRLCDPKFAG